MNILVVDDEISFRMLVKDHLSDMGFTVFLAEDGIDGLIKLEEEKIDLVISDLHMDGMDGLRLCAEAREFDVWRNIPFLFVSAYGDESTLTTIREFGKCSFLSKNQSMDELVEQIALLTTPDAPEGTEPASEAPVPRAEKEVQKTPRPPSECSLLVVDDDDALRMLLATILEKEGYKVAMASDGDQALEIFGQQAFDLVLLDIMMPTISGLEVLKIFKEKSPSTKVVMLTAYSQLKVAVQTKELGADDFIAKPFMRPDLLNTIKGLLSR